MELSRRHLGKGLLATSILVAGGFTASWASASPTKLEVFKSPYCGCCGAWINRMRLAGFQVRVFEMEDVSSVKERLGVPEDLQSCHTAVIHGYVIEGHVPASDIRRLLSARPMAAGLAVPGMPVGSPGMEQGNRRDPYQVILFSRSGRSAFSRY